MGYLLHFRSAITLSLLLAAAGCSGDPNGNGIDNSGDTSLGGSTGGSGDVGDRGGKAESSGGKAGSSGGKAGSSGGKPSGGPDETGDGGIGGENTGGTREPVAEEGVGPTGGTVTTDDESVSVAIPASALTGNVTVTVAPAETPAEGAIGTVYDIGPTGTVFATPVTITLSYEGTDLGATDESSLRVATYGNAGWQILTGATLDKAHHTVSGLTNHLSPYGIISSAKGALCANLVLGPLGCTSATDSSTSCTSTVPTCASSANACAAFPGSIMGGCNDDPALGVVASCCYPPTTPLCFAWARACSGSSSLDGPVPVDVCPSCADAEDSCSKYPGSKTSNCEDTGHGINGNCCFDPGTPVCVTAEPTPCTSTDSSCAAVRHCADGNPCADFPGTTATGCVDNNTGFAASCCYPQGTLPPTDLSNTGGAGAGGSGGGSGSVGGTAGAGGSVGGTAGAGGSVGGTAGAGGSVGGTAGSAGSVGGTGGSAGSIGGTGGSAGSVGGTGSTAGSPSGGGSGGPTAGSGGGIGTGGTAGSPSGGGSGGPTAGSGGGIGIGGTAGSPSGGGTGGSTAGSGGGIGTGGTAGSPSGGGTGGPTAGAGGSSAGFGGAAGAAAPPFP